FLPRLVERDGDIQALTWHFIDGFNARGGRQITGVGRDVMDAFLAYPWPGNIRELRNAVEYAFAIGEGPVLSFDELLPELRGEAPRSSSSRAGFDPGFEERERILSALRATQGRKGEAAKRLGINRSTLWRKLREFQIEGH
ncbi:MAG TPA: sigma-54-dependent Fis family transcriptional regulator, partial [Nannocystis exedens]|nr:sigma-54-dependent Fis family transcriptional regulator [Nannocystis exedens]